MRRILGVALIGALAPWLAAFAQSPGERASLDSVRAGYEAQADTAWLITHEQERIAVARVDRGNPMLHMELGYLAYRLGEITGARKRYQDAASEFQWASDLRPQWPYAWYQLGLSELATGEAGVIILESIRQILGLDFLSRAARSFERAVQADPGFSRAVVDLATTALRQRINSRLVVVQGVLRQVAGTDAGRVADVELARGRIERRLNEPDSALVGFRAYLALGGDSGIGSVELARTHALLGRVDSCVTWYFRGVSRRMSDSVRSDVRRDLRWIASPAELAAFDSASADSVAAFLHRFWEARDAADGRRAGERLADQFRRYDHAQQSFGLVSRRRGTDVSFAFSDTTQTEFDDRGVVYLRHGEPSERAQFAESGYDANESWLYQLGGPLGDVVLHFVAMNKVSDFRLAETLRTVCRPRGRNIDPVLNGGLILGRTAGDAAIRANAGGAEIARCIQSRAGLSGVYERLARNTSDNMWAGERLASLAMVRAAVTTDSYVHHYAASLRPIVSWFAVADEGMQPELHLIFAVPATRLHPVATPDGASAYPLGLRLLVTDSATGRLVAALDTVRAFRSAQRLGPGAFLTEQMVLHVPAGRFRYAFVIEEQHADAGDAVSHQELIVPHLDGAFSASDVVLGREGSGLAWHRSIGDVPLNPLMRFPRDGEATIYYEVYGLPLGASVGTRVRVTSTGGRSLLRRLFGGGGGADLAYTTVTDAPGRSTVRQRIDLHGLAPGRYTLQVELADPLSGTRVVRTSPFEIEGRSAP